MKSQIEQELKKVTSLYVGRINNKETREALRYSLTNQLNHLAANGFKVDRLNDFEIVVERKGVFSIRFPKLEENNYEL